MSNFESLNLNKQLLNALGDLGLTSPTAIQEQAFNVILSGDDVVGIAQTGTGKTFAYLLPILNTVKYSLQKHPRILIMVPTRELVLQVVENINELCAYMDVRVLGVYGGTNMNTQKKAIDKGADVVVATPGRLYDLILSRAIRLKEIKRLVIDEVDVMLDLGFRFQLTNIFELLPERRQNIMFSATMTSDVDTLIDDFFISPKRITIAVSGTPLENIEQSCYSVPNFFTKLNLLNHILSDKEEYSKVILFVSIKRSADKIYDALHEVFGDEIGVLHANKSQNFRIRTIGEFNENKLRVLVTTDVMARGIDIEKVSHVINFDVPKYPENYMHRIGRTGRAKEKGSTILLFTAKEEKRKAAIEELMNMEIPILEIPQEVEIAKELTPEEMPYKSKTKSNFKELEKGELPPGFHEKKAKNKKVAIKGSVRRRKKAEKYNKPQTKRVNKKKVKKR